MNKQILVIKTKDKKEYYTDYRNLPTITEFAKTFECELFLAQSNNITIMNLEKLVSALCDDSYQTPKIDQPIKIIRKLFLSSKKEIYSRQQLIKNAHFIRKHIQILLEKGNVVKISDVKRKFHNLNLTDSCISNHMAMVRKNILKNGRQVQRLKNGVYKLCNLNIRDI